MSSLYDELVADPKVDYGPGVFAATVDGVRCIIATISDGVVYLTEEGKKYRGEAADKPKASKKAVKKVESANTLVDEPDDLDLGE